MCGLRRRMLMSDPIPWEDNGRTERIIDELVRLMEADEEEDNE
jgi:hypothetical protein